MGTEYKIAEDVYLAESSCEVRFILVKEGDIKDECSKWMSAQDLKEAILEQIFVLSYISEEPEEVLKRFNVDYGDEE